MNLTAVATALRALADALEDTQAPSHEELLRRYDKPLVAEAPAQREMLEPEPPAPAPASTGAPAFNMYAPAAAAAPAQATTPAITKEDVINVAQQLTQKIGQNEANGFIGQVLAQAGAERVSTATAEQLAQMYGKLALRLKEAS